MAKKDNGLNMHEARVLTEVLRSFTAIITEPMYQTMISWWWLQKKSSLGWDDRQMLKAGIIDMAQAKAGIDKSFITELLGGAAGIVQGASDIAAGAAIGAATGGGSEALLAGAQIARDRLANKPT